MAETDWTTKKDPGQVTKAVYDVPTNSLNTNIVGGNLTISHTEDSIKVGDGVDLMVVNADGSINNILQNVPVPFKYDYFSAAYPTDTTEVFTYRTGGSGGSVVATITLVYVDNSKSQISSFTRA